jgi:hypothetical protein
MVGDIPKMQMAGQIELQPAPPYPATIKQA